MNCPFCCNETKLEIILKSSDLRFRQSKNFLLVRCCSCGSVFTHDFSKKKKAYPEFLFEKDKDRENFINSRKYKHVSENLKKGDEVLDVGFGDGSFLEYLKSKKHIVMGIESSELAVKNLQRKGVEAILGDFESEKIGRKFDLITMWHSFEHMINPLGVLKKTRRIIKKNGILAIEAPNYASLQAMIFSKYWYGLDLPRHRFHFSPQVLSTLLEKSGFGVIRTEFSDYYESLMHFTFSLANFFGLSSINTWGIKENRIKETKFKKLVKRIACNLANVFYPFIWFESKIKKGGVFVVLARPKPILKNCAISVGIPAYNEEKDIESTIKAILNQNLRKKIKLEEIIVIADGCTDSTGKIVNDLSSKDGRIKLISKKKREGKSAAINTILKKAKAEIVVIANADNLPDPNCLIEVVSPLANKKIGLVGPQIVCINDDRDFIGYLNNLLWRLHHNISLIEPKMGGFIALRKKDLDLLPVASPVDEATIEAIIELKNKKVVYAPLAKLYLKGPNSLAEYFKQRRRIHYGYFWLKNNYIQYQPSTFKARHLFSVLAKEVSFNLVNNFFLLSAILIEIIAKIAGYYDFKRGGKDYQRWEMIGSSKGLELEK